MNAQSKINLAAALSLSVTSLLIFPAHAGSKAPKNVISLDQARQTALKVFGGTVKSEELEYEHKRWIYSFDLQGVNDANIHEVQINALTGEVVSNKTETTADEKSEAEHDRG